MKIIKIEKENVDLFAPYSGVCIYGEQAEEYGVDTDSTCLFSYFEEAGWVDVSERVKVQLESKGIVDYSEMTPIQLSELLDFDGGLTVEYNAGWNGKSWFAFAPV